MAELADAGDLKSPPRSGVRVRFPARPNLESEKRLMFRIQRLSQFCICGMCLLLLGLVGCQAGGAGTVRLRAENWNPTPGGSIQASDLGSIGDIIDLESDLGLGEEKGLWVYGVEADLGIGTLELTNIEFSTLGSRVVSSAIDFGGSSFEAGTIGTNFEVEVTKVRNKGSLFGFGPVGLKYLWGLDNLIVDTTLSGALAGGGGQASVSRTLDEWIPTIGVGAYSSIPIGNDWSFELDAEIAGLWVSVGDIDGTYQGTTLRAGIRQGSGILLGVGHRSLILDIKDDGSGTGADFDLGGTFLFLEWAI